MSRDGREGRGDADLDAILEEMEIGEGEGDAATGGAGTAEGGEAASGTDRDPGAEYAELHDRHLRLAAEFDNYRRRMQGDLAEAGTRAQAALIGRLMDSVDDLQRVSLLDPATATVESIVEGVDLVERKLLKVLADLGVEISSPEGEPFDPNRMEALMRVPGTEAQVDRVAQVFQRGVSVKGILVRPSRVSVYTAD